MSTRSSVDWARERAAFPLLDQRRYFASHAVGLFPELARADLAVYHASLRGRLGAVAAHLARIEEIRGLIERLLNAAPNSVALCASATAAQASLASALVPVGARRRILVSSAGFPSSRYLWQAQERRGFEVVEVPCRNGAPDAEQVSRLIDERTAVIALPHVSPLTGALLDVAAIGAKARHVGALFVLDAYQSVGAIPLDVGQQPIDVVVAGCHKWLGATSMGLAFLYVNIPVAEQLMPAFPGWLGHEAFPHTPVQFQPASGARRFQVGTPAVEPAYGARAGLRWVLEVGVAAIRNRSLELTSRLLDRARELDLPLLQLPDAGRGATVALPLTPQNAERVVKQLEAQGIDIDSRSGASDAAYVRISPHPCARLDECVGVVDSLARALRAPRQGFEGRAP